MSTLGSKAAEADKFAGQIVELWARIEVLETEVNTGKEEVIEEQKKTKALQRKLADISRKLAEIHPE